MLSPHQYTDEEWLELMIDGLEGRRADVPGGPPSEVQTRFVGLSGGSALRKCFGFYRLTKRLYGGDLADDCVLDFGVGWGRMMRLFAHDVPREHLFGVDVDAEILDVCKQTEVPGSLGLVEPGGRLPFDDASFGLAYAYSVFSHLSAEAALEAFGELARVVRPGGQLTFTIQGRRFLKLCCTLRKKSRRNVLTEAEATIDSFFEDPFLARANYGKGEYVFTGIGGTAGVLTGDFYGWAAIPESWLRSNLRHFVLDDITDDPAVDEQVIVTARRTSRSPTIGR
jgi:SAM-dependent methyltransferase